MTSAITIPDLVAQIRTAYAAAQEEARQAVYQSGCAVRKAVETGKLLAEAQRLHKGDKGGFRAFLAEHCPEIHFTTAYRWIRLAEAPAELWKDAASLRQALIAVGVLPEPEPPQGGDQEPPKFNYLVHLVRFSRAIEKQPVDPAKLKPHERELLRERIRPVAELYAKLA